MCKTSTGNSLNEYPSPNRRFSLVVDFCAGAFDLYLADRETSQITHINRLPVDTYGQGGNNDTIPFIWSPDGRSVIYDNGLGNFYLINLELAMQDSQVEPTKLLDLESLGVDILFDFTWQSKP